MPSRWIHRDPSRAAHDHTITRSHVRGYVSSFRRHHINNTDMDCTEATVTATTDVDVDVDVDVGVPSLSPPPSEWGLVLAAHAHLGDARAVLRYSHQPERLCPVDDLGFPLEDARHVQTPDGRFHAVYNAKGQYVDIWSLGPALNEHHGYKVPEHLGTLRRDKHHTNHFVMHFINIDRGDGSWRLVFNRRFEGLSVYELPSLTEIYRDKKIHMCDYLGSTTALPVAEGATAAERAVAQRFLWAWSWGWGLQDHPRVYDLHQLAATGDPSVALACDDAKEESLVRRYRCFVDEYTYKRSADDASPPVEFVRYDPVGKTLYVRPASGLRLREYASDTDADDSDDASSM